MLITFLKGILVGLVVAIPVGPVGLFCLERTMSYGWKKVLPSIIVMAVADVCSAVLVIVGISYVIAITKEYDWIVKICTGSLFAGVGAQLIYSRNQPPKKLTASQVAATGLTTFLLSVSPVTLGLMLVLFPMLELASIDTMPPTLPGIFVGSGIWGSLILIGGHYIGMHLQGKVPLCKLIAGCVFIAISLISIIHSLISHFQLLD